MSRTEGEREVDAYNQAARDSRAGEVERLKARIKELEAQNKELGELSCEWAEKHGRLVALLIKNGIQVT